MDWWEEKGRANTNVFISMVAASPGQPVNLTVDDVNDNSVTLTWDAPEQVGPKGLDGYLVEYCKDGSRLYSLVSMELHVLRWKTALHVECNCFIIY